MVPLKMDGFFQTTFPKKMGVAIFSGWPLDRTWPFSAEQLKYFWNFSHRFSGDVFFPI